MARRNYASRTCGMLTFEHEGWEVVNPFVVGDRLRKKRLEDGDFSIPSYDEYMREDLRVLSQCEMVVFCPGWHISDGCREEMRECWWRGIEVAFLSEDGKVFYNNNNNVYERRQQQ